MSGLKVIRSLLAANAPLTAAVLAENIIGDVVPLNAPLPAIGVTTISATDDRPLKRGSTRHVMERVQVTLLTNDAPSRLRIMGLIKSAAADRIGDIAGVSRVSVLTDGRGPDFTTDAGLRGASIDFLVSYNEAA